eukprot:8849858-Pyramimonas_sp.AAC.1
MQPSRHAEDTEGHSEGAGKGDQLALEKPLRHHPELRDVGQPWRDPGRVIGGGARDHVGLLPTGRVRSFTLLDGASQQEL